MTLVTVARIVAIALSAGTFAFLFIGDAWRGDNLFLVPDLILCAALLIAVALPAVHAVPSLIFAFGLSAGVLGTAVSSYAVQDQFGAPPLIAATVAVVMAALLIRSRIGDRTTGGTP